MREELHRFFRAARGAGVRVSPAESIDAMRAVTQVGFADRGLLRDTLLVTLAKTQEEKQALGECFDLFFSRPEPPPPPEESDESSSDQSSESQGQSSAPGAPGQGGGDGSAQPELGELAQMLLGQDRSAVAAALSGAAAAAELSNIRYFTQRGLFQGRMMEALGIGRLRDDLDALKGATPAEAERL
ncbi:VWA containing CoxE family protein, partial [Rhodopseudomonas sp. AAP120]